MTKLRTRAFAAALVAVGAIVLAAPAAEAAYRGANGKIAFISDRSGSGHWIYTMNPDGTDERLVASDEVQYYEPSWSADGKKLAASFFGSSQTGIKTMNADGTAPTDVVPRGGRLLSGPTWSPSGNQIAYGAEEGCSMTGFCEYSVYRVNADGTGNVRLTEGNEPAWSPLGDKLAIATQRYETSPIECGIDCNFEIAIVNSDGTGGVRLTNTSAVEGSPAWSPDGSKIAFTSQRDGNYEIYVVGSDGTGEMRLTDNPAFDTGPAWSPDGSKIVFASTRNGQGELYAMNPDGTGLTRLTENATGEGSPDWQPLSTAGYARPKGATPVLVSLVPAYQVCTAPNSTHGSPLAAPACSPPFQSSQFLTPGYPENGAQAKMVGSVRLDVSSGSPTAPPDEADIALKAAIADVRCHAVTATAVCPSENGVGRPTDYGGELSAVLDLRITDKQSGGGSISGTVQDLPFKFDVPCAATPADTTVGSTCSVTTTAEAVVPLSVTEGKRAIWEIGQVAVFDGGADGDPATADGDGVYLKQGIFIP